MPLAGGLLVCLGFALFQAWFLGWHHGLVHTTSRGDLVDAYVETLADGKTYLQTPVARLAELPPNQQPPTDPRTRILDASYFEGRYYVYYGILPFAAVLVPWKLVTGSFLNAETYIGAVLIAGNLLLVLGFGRLYRGRPEVPGIGPLLGAVIAIVCSGSLQLMDTPAIHQVESATGYLLGCAAFYAGIRAWTDARGRLAPWLVVVAAASLLPACRPNQIFVLLLVLGWAAREVAVRSAGPARTKRLVALGAIPAAVALALASYNSVRFGNPLEFGMSYGTGAIDRPETVGFSLTNLAYNLRAYLGGAAQLEPYFPFIGGPAGVADQLRPAHHEGLNQVYGIFVFFPALLLLGVAALRRFWWTAALVVLAAASLLYLGGLGFGTYRYTADFAVFLAIAAGIGGAEFCAGRPGVGRALRIASVIGLAAVSSVGAVCVAASIAVRHGTFAGKRAVDFAHLARPFNAVVYRLENHLGTAPRALALEVEMPRRFGQVEPLLVTGIEGRQDFLYVHYADERSIRLGLESMGQGGPVSPLLAWDYAKPHRIELRLGNLYPPDDHPMFRGMSAAEIADRRNRIAVFIDGEKVFEAPARFHPIHGYRYLGKSPFDAAFGKTFTGRMTVVEGTRLP
jgi:hypothetical protein